MKSSVFRIFNRLTEIVAVALVLIFSAACQQTPETEAVIPRDNTEKAVIESAQSEGEEFEEMYDAPIHVQDRFEIIENYMDVMIDADVYTPDVSQFAVAKIKPVSFTKDQADKIKEYFAGGAEMREYTEMTKSDYDAMIIEAKRGLLIDGEYVISDESKAWVEELIQRRANAPEDGEATAISDYSIADGISADIVLNGEGLGSIELSEKVIAFTTGMARIKSDKKILDTQGNADTYKNLPDIEINMFESEAIAAGEKLLSDLGIDGMVLKQIDSVLFYKGDPMKAEYGGYQMVFMREFSGMLPLYMTSYTSNQSEPEMDYSIPVEMECILISINDTGAIEHFFWTNPIEIVETLSESVPLISFDDLMTRMKDFSKYQWAYMGEHAMMGNAYKTVKYVGDIGLYLCYLPIQNDPSAYMYSPCWVFTYKTVEFKKDDLELMESDGTYPGFYNSDYENIANEYMIFSAIDGASVRAFPVSFERGE